MDPDNRIAAALDSDDHAFLASLESDRGIFQQLGDSMAGQINLAARQRARNNQVIRIEFDSGRLTRG